MDADKAVQLAMALKVAVGHGHHVGVVERAIRGDLDQAGADGHAGLLRQGAEALGGWTGENGLGQGFQVSAGTTEINLVCRDASGNASVFAVQMSAMFFPTRY